MSNPVLDIGLFSILLGLAFFFTFYAFRNIPNGRGFLRILAVSLFCILSIYMGSGYQVEYDSSVTNQATNETWAEKDVVIAGGESTSWISWIFAGFAMANLIFLLRDYQGGT